MRRVGLLALLVLFAASVASAASGRTLRGNGVTLSLPAGWYGLVGSAGVQAADFPLAARVRSSANLARVPRGHVHLIVWNYGPWVLYRPHVHPARAPLTLRRQDVGGPFEGFPQDDAYAIRTARLDGEMLEVLADLGPKPLAPDALGKANAALATLRVLPSRVLRPRRRRLAADGVAVRLPRGWSGRIEIPPGRYGARLVLRGARGDLHLELLEYAETDGSGPHLELPVLLRNGDLVRRDSLSFAHRVFSTGGRSFDLSVTARSARELDAANRLLATLTVAPRPWTFQSCDLSLRLPGTWRAGISPRSGCYPVLKLHGPGVLVVLTELRPDERASGRILRRAGRRFLVEVTPASARPVADTVLTTLRVKPRLSGG